MPGAEYLTAAKLLDLAKHVTPLAQKHAHQQALLPGGLDSCAPCHHGIGFLLTSSQAAVPSS